MKDSPLGGGSMKTSKIFLILISLIFTLLPQVANADTLKECRIPRSEAQDISLGFPLRSERLANIKSPKILVLHYQLKGESTRDLSQDEKNVFFSVIQDVRAFSSNLNTPEIIFSEPIEIPWTSNELDEVKLNVNKTWGKDFSNSTYGFVEQVIKFTDGTIDYRGIDAVLLYGKSISAKQQIAEAMTFTSESFTTYNSKRADGSNWFDPVITNEGPISNIALLYNNSGRMLITHELMHLYGLTDLYGGSSGPGVLSLMESQWLNLLTYEKWVLGWHPDSQVKCLSNFLTSTISQYSLEFRDFNEILIITTKSGANYVVETLTFQGTPVLIFYAVENDLRPPLTLFRDSSGASSDVQIGNPQGIGTQFNVSEFNLLITDIDSKKITIDLVGSSQINSANLTELKVSASKNKAARTDEFAKAERLQAEVKAVAELKAKQEAEAKALAELKAKQEAEAKMAAELKAKQEADAKAAAAIVAANKKTTISCVKGKLIKRVTAVKPKCPSGYKLKK
jgi:hypothetical protein